MRVCVCECACVRAVHLGVQLRVRVRVRVRVCLGACAVGQAGGHVRLREWAGVRSCVYCSHILVVVSAIAVVISIKIGIQPWRS